MNEWFCNAVANWADRKGCKVYFRYKGGSVSGDDFCRVWEAVQVFKDGFGTFEAVGVCFEPVRATKKAPAETFEDYEIRVSKMMNKAAVNARRSRIGICYARAQREMAAANFA